jgi:hypothetical protein
MNQQGCANSPNVFFQAMPPTQQKQGRLSISSGLTLDVSDVVLTTIRNAASVSTIPFFKEAADLALGILNIIQVHRDVFFNSSSALNL